MNPPIRYKVQQDKGEYCLKACADGDLVDWSSYAALETAVRKVGYSQRYADKMRTGLLRIVARTDGLRDDEASRIAHEALLPPKSDQPADPDEVKQQRLKDWIAAHQRLGDMAADTLVELALEHFENAQALERLLVEELCSRVHPGWENDVREHPLDETERVRLGLPVGWDAACAYALQIIPTGLKDDHVDGRRYMLVRNAYLQGAAKSPLLERVREELMKYVRLHEEATGATERPAVLVELLGENP